MTIHSNSNFSFSSSFNFVPSVFTDEMPKDVLSADRDLFQSCNRLEDDAVVDRLPSATKFKGEWGDDLFQEIFDDLETENARAAFNYGEVGIGNYNHATEMSGLDRMIFEDCNPGSGKIQRAGMNLPKTPKNRRPEVLAADINKAVGQIVCSIERAGDLIDFWEIIAGDSDGYKALYWKFRTWTVQRTKETGKITVALKYFHKIAAALIDSVSLQEPEDCDIPVQAIVNYDTDEETVNPEKQAAVDWYRDLAETLIEATHLSQPAKTLSSAAYQTDDDDEAEALIETVSLSQSEIETISAEDWDNIIKANIKDNRYMATGEVITSDWYKTEIKTEITAEDWDAVIDRRSWVDEAGNRHLDASMTEPIPEPVKYQNFSYQSIHDGEWISEQPIWYRDLLKSSKTADMKLLKSLGDWVQHHKLTSQQGKVFWDIYKRRMAAFDKRLRKNLSDTAKIIVSRIRNASPRKLGFIGFWLHDQQNNGGKTPPLKHPVKPEEYRLLWKEYKQMKL